MVTSRLAELPAPPAGRTGWPWTEETPPLSATVPEGGPWPTISIVTPSFNQGAYLEETIRSILLQGYPKLEYIVVDGGSTDNSVAMIKKYERWLTYWVSERDHGQADAINKGLARCTGEIFNWINSDDYLLAGALGKIAAAFHETDAVAGIVLNFNEEGLQDPLVPLKLEAEKLVFADPTAQWHQPGVWMRREKVIECGGIDASYQYSFDWDLTIRYLNLFPRVNYLSDVLVHFRLHPQSKTTSSWKRFMEERYRILHKLATTAPQFAMRAACRRQIRNLDWFEAVAAVRNNQQRPRLLRAIQLATVACLDPQIRLTRFTLGAIRRLIFPNTV
jgi:glycosyltransferase involved in cell wall biosynthesis